MPTTKSPAPPKIYQIKVTLLGSKPPIWRRLLVPAALTLEQLHSVIQIAMGWQDCHLHEFRIGRVRYSLPDPVEIDMDVDTTNERSVRVFSVLGKVGAKAIYTYDFGDGWEHSLMVEKVLPPDPALAYPLCTGGKRHCPPEDCGGVWGYDNLLNAIRDPDHEDHEQMQEWLGEGLDPEAFSVEEVNQRLAPRPHRKAKQ